jgi:hypothetical protein
VPAEVENVRFHPHAGCLQESKNNANIRAASGDSGFNAAGAALDQWGALLVEQLSQWVEELVLNDLFATMCIVFLVVGHFEYFVPARKIPGATTRRS